LRRHGVIPSFEVTEMERRNFKYKDSGALMQETLIKLTYRFTSMIDGSVHVVAVNVPGESADSGDKSATKAVTVACRVALLQGLAIPTQDPDPDEQTHERGEEIPAGPPQASKEEKDRIFAEIQELPVDRRRRAKREFKAEFGDLADLPEARVDEVWKFVLRHQLEDEAERAGVDPETGELVTPKTAESDPF
jgi:hypothetical protein